MDAERAEYLQAIERRFVELCGRGLMLGPADVAVLDTWFAAGVPAHVVLRTLDEGFRQFRSTQGPRLRRPKTLRYFVPLVDEALERRRSQLLYDEPLGASGPAGAKDEDGAAAARVLDAIVQTGRELESEQAREVLRDAWRRLREGEGDAWALTRELDAQIVAALGALLEEDERERFEGEAATRVAARGGERMSPKAREEATAGEVGRMVRERFRVPEFMEVLLASKL